eukprot:364721-Chlamydomonas_euryale.AAC.8
MRPPGGAYAQQRVPGYTDRRCSASRAATPAPRLWPTTTSWWSLREIGMCEGGMLAGRDPTGAVQRQRDFSGLVAFNS